MQVSELFENLSYGSLSNLSIGGEGSGVIPADKQPKLINLINQALLALYQRFSLLEKEVIIRTSAAVSTYVLDSKYADSTLDVVPFKYIDDSDLEPFEDDVIKILGVFDLAGTELTLNDSGNISSIYTPTPQSIQIPAPKDGDALFVIYQAKHPKLTGDVTQEILLPFGLHTALNALVGHLVYGGMSGQENSAKSQELRMTYENLCMQNETKDLVNSSLVDTNCKLHERGFA